MNFLVRTREGKCLTRPDTTFNKNKEDYYVPDDVSALGWTPFVAARMSEAGKMISPRFVGRYWDAVAFGVLLYPDSCPLTGSCFDRTTMLPLPLYDRCTLEPAENIFKVTFEGRELFSCGSAGIREALEEAICDCTLHSSVRRGDYVLRELDTINALCSRQEGLQGGRDTALQSDTGGNTAFQAIPGRRLQCSWCGNETLDIGIIF